MKKRSKIFIIGARGYIGNCLFAKAKLSHSVIGTSSLGGNGLLRFNLNFPLDFEYSNVNPGDIVLLAAAISSPDICSQDFARAWALNVIGTSKFIKNIIDLGARVIFFSTDAVYGESEEIFDESAPANPIGEYAVMKHEVEQLFEGNPLFKSIRLSYVFSREDKFSSLLARYAERQEVVDIFHPFLRAIVHRNDVIKGVLAIAERWDEIPEQIINFGGPKILSRVHIAEYLREIVFTNVQFNVVEPDIDFFKSRPRVIAMSSPIFCRILGRSPKTFYEATKLEFNILT